jgi:P-type E1-E2 ATPase
MEVRFENKKYFYKLLEVLEFNSTRKRMSVIVQDDSNNIIIFCKGADSIIEKRMVPSEFKEKTFTNLQNYGNIGLRTLLLAK